MPELQPALICDYVRTPIGRFGGALAKIRSDDLAAITIRELMRRYPALTGSVEEVFLGCANQAGEDNRNVARMSLLLAGLPDSVPGITYNRLCSSGMDAVAGAARSIQLGEIGLAIAGGVESMTRAPMVMGKAEAAFQRTMEVFDTTIGWRFVNPILKEQYGVDALPATAENVAEEFAVSRQDQDAFAFRSQQRTAAAMNNGIYAEEIVAVETPNGKKGTLLVEKDEHPRADTSMEALAGLKPIVRPGGTITAGNASGVNDGAAALILASPAQADRLGLLPLARFVGAASAAVPPRIMGMGPVPATEKLLARLGWSLGSVEVIEMNEAFASQSLACLRKMGLPDDAEHVNPNGGAIALGHPLGMSGARIAGAVIREMVRRKAKRSIATMCVGVGQGVSIAFESL